MPISTILNYAAALIAVIFVFAPHEFAHAYVAYRCGDPTAKMRGRLTLNPVKHFDPIGFVLCALVGFGWAKPVPIDPSNFRNYRKGLFFTSIAGVVANYIVAFFAYALLLVVAKYFPKEGNLLYVYWFFYYLFSNLFIFNLGVFLFNLLPFNPLDGFRIVESLTREINPVRRFLKEYGFYILVIVVLESFLCNVIDDYMGIHWIQYFNVLGYVRWFAHNILGYPIMALWNAIFGLPLPILPPIV